MALEPREQAAYSQDAQDPSWFMRGRSALSVGSRRSRRGRRATRLNLARSTSKKARTRSPAPSKANHDEKDGEPCEKEMDDHARRKLASELEANAPGEGASADDEADSNSPPPTRASCNKYPAPAPAAPAPVRDSTWWRNIC